MKIWMLLFSLLCVTCLFTNEVTASKKPTHKLVRDTLNKVFGKEESLLYRCDLQCYCDRCSANSPAFKKKCDDLLPKRRIPNCVCENDIDCPTPEELDDNCMIYCFCKNCRDDPRMIPQLINHCNANKDLIHDCDCEKYADCNVLDLLPSKDAKAGRLKEAAYHPEL